MPAKKKGKKKAKGSSKGEKEGEEGGGKPEPTGKEQELRRELVGVHIAYTFLHLFLYFVVLK